MGSVSTVDALRRSLTEPEAFAAFYDHHVEALLAYLTRRVFDPEVAIDLTAESFAQAYVARWRFRGSTDEAATAWLYRIAERQLSRYVRRGIAERKALKRLGLERPSLDEDQRARIEELAELADLRDVLRMELRHLSQAHRDALRLRVVEELPYWEVARRLGISEQAARARVSRGLRALASALNRKSLPKEISA